MGKTSWYFENNRAQRKQRLWVKALVNVLSDQNHFDIQLDSSLTLEPRYAEIEEFLKEARKGLFAPEKSSITCKIIPG